MDDCKYHGKCNSIADECKQLRENDRVIMIELGAIKERIVAIEQSTRSAHHRIDGIEGNTEAIIRMSVSIENMTEEIKRLIPILDDHDKRIDDIERGPGDSAVKWWQLIAATFVTGLLGLLFGLALKKLGG